MEEFDCIYVFDILLSTMAWYTGIHLFKQCITDFLIS